jgi:hypothetical protein
MEGNMNKASVLSIESLKAMGFSGLSGLMAAFTFLSAAAVMLSMCLFLSVGLFLYRADPIHKSWNYDRSAINIQTTGIVLKDQRSTDPACVAEVVRKGGSDVSKCPLVPTQPTGADVAAFKKSATSLTGKIYFFLPTLINIVPASVLSFGLFQAGLCFLQLSGGRYFAQQTIRNLRNFAFAGLFYVVITPCIPLIYALLANLISSINLHFFTPKSVTSFNLPGPYTPPVSPLAPPRILPAS